jgi:hypothetical protein
MNRSKLYYSVKNAVENGCGVDFGRLSICDLGKHVQMRDQLERKYQVDCDDSRFRFSEVYYKLDVAVDKFMLIRSVLDKGQLNDEA